MTIEPQPVIPLEYAKPSTSTHDRRWWLAARVSLLLAGLCLLAGWGLMFMDVETAVVTGPMLALMGVVLVGSGWRLKLMPAMLLGIAHCSICLLFFTLVNVRNWSPSEAAVPFRIMTGMYLVIVGLPGSILVLTHMRVKGATRFSSSLPAPACLSSNGRGIS
jgi:hypothetical protein